MKVLHVSYMDGSGGAHIAARRLCEAQINYGIDAELLVVNKVTTKPYVRQLTLKRKLVSMFGNMFNQYRVSRQQKPTNSIMHSLNSVPNRIDRVINMSDCDVVNLHWINGEFFSVEDIKRIKKPIVWTLHDMWPFSGAEHYDDLSYPGRFITGYTAKNRPKGYTGPDFDKKVYNRKLNSYNQNINLVCPSSWMKSCSEQSKLFGSNRHWVVGNTLDRDIFKPLDSTYCRQLFNLPLDKKLVLFGAFNSTGDPRKGGDKLHEALTLLQVRPEEVEFVMFGGVCKGVEIVNGYTTHHLGCFSDEQSLVALYNAVNLFVAPSLQDNLPNTILEAQACGTPTTAFNVGGIGDMVLDGKTGYLARPGDIADLAHRIDLGLDADFSDECRSYFLNNFEASLVAEKYDEVYENMIGI